MRLVPAQRFPVQSPPPTPLFALGVLLPRTQSCPSPPSHPLTPAQPPNLSFQQVSLALPPHLGGSLLCPPRPTLWGLPVVEVDNSKGTIAILSHHRHPPYMTFPMDVSKMTGEMGIFFQCSQMCAEPVQSWLPFLYLKRWWYVAAILCLFPD